MYHITSYCLQRRDFLHFRGDRENFFASANSRLGTALYIHHQYRHLTEAQCRVRSTSPRLLASTFKLTHYPESGPVRKLPALAVPLPDRPGGLHQVTAVLSRAAINIENASGFAVSGGDAILILEVADLPAAERALADADFKTLDEGEFETAVA